MTTPVSQIPPGKLEEIAFRSISHRRSYFLGPYVIGMMIDAVLFGVLIQLYIKWHSYSLKEERKVVRWLVWYIMGFAVGSSIFLIAWIFHLFIHNFGTYGQFLDMKWTQWWFILTTAGRLPVSIFFAHRAWEMLGRSKIFLGVISLLFAAVAGTSLATKLVFRRNANLTLTLVLVNGGCEALADIIVTITIAICLSKSKTGWAGTDKLITKLLYLVVETQLPPTLMTILFLGLFISLETRPLTNLHACSPKVYAVCLMLILNSRQRLRKDLSMHQEYDLSHLSKDGTPTLPYGGRSRNVTHVQVTTETTTHVQRDTIARPKFSVNRAPIEDDLHVQLDGDAETDKDSWEGRLNSSEVRLTKVKEDA